MNRTAHFYSRLRFSRNRLARPVLVTLSVAVFLAAWLLLSDEVLLTLMLPAVAFLVWLASYGWRAALLAVRDLADRLQQL